jgi:hypothetical protein
MAPLRPILITALLFTAGVTMADELDAVPPVTNAATRKECGECHMAFQPALLPATSWNRIMDTLDQHFGENASLAPDIAAEIRAYLTANAGRGDPARLRITEQRWWRHEHDFRPAAWQRPEVRSPANCEACHPGAAQGLYEGD